MDQWILTAPPRLPLNNNNNNSGGLRPAQRSSLGGQQQQRAERQSERPDQSTTPFISCHSHWFVLPPLASLTFQIYFFFVLSFVALKFHLTTNCASSFEGGPQHTKKTLNSFCIYPLYLIPFSVTPHPWSSCIAECLAPMSGAATAIRAARDFTER